MPEVPVLFTDVKGMRLHYIATGAGAPLVLLHTLKTQLKIFAPMLPALAAHFSVYAPDYPGHGYSESPDEAYDAPFFSAAIEGFLERLDLQNVTLAGISIGGVIALVLAARHNPRIRRVISINPYDYGSGLGLARSSLFGWVVTQSARLPALGEIVIPRAPQWLVKRVLAGGVVDAGHLPAELAREIYDTGNLPGQARAFLRLLRNAKSWPDMQQHYRDIALPVLLIWSDEDWSRPSERERTAALIPGVLTKSLPGGHFLSLDRPEELARLIIGFAEP